MGDFDSVIVPSTFVHVPTELGSCWFGVSFYDAQNVLRLMTYFSSLLFPPFQRFSDFLLQLNWKWANMFNEMLKYHSLNICKYLFLKLLHSLLFNLAHPHHFLLGLYVPEKDTCVKSVLYNFLQLFNVRFPFFLFFATDREGSFPGKWSALHLNLRIIVVV